jgi:hypothetical protein
MATAGICTANMEMYISQNQYGDITAVSMTTMLKEQFTLRTTIAIHKFSLTQNHTSDKHGI